jgi:hypothetical protein
MWYYNIDERFGECGPFKANSKEQLADEMEPTLMEWATEEVEKHPGMEMEDCVAQIRASFINALVEVVKNGNSAEDK